MKFTPNENLTIGLNTKIKSVISGKPKVRKITDLEALEIESLEEWQNGYFVDNINGNAQIVLSQRQCGQYVINCISGGLL